MKTFKLFWLDGKTEKVKGNSIADAFTKAGYGNGALPALNYYEEIKNEGKNFECVACDCNIKEEEKTEMYGYTICNECNNPI